MKKPLLGRKRLTRKQERLARARVKDPEATLTELGLKVGYKDAAHTKRELDKSHVRDRVRELLEASPKLRVPALLRKLEEGLDAKETKFFAHEGKVRDQRDCIDFPTRHHYLRTALDLHGLNDKEIKLNPGQTIKALLLEDD